MPTPSEQKALAFVALIILLGGAVRVVRAGAAERPTESEQQALEDQATAADRAAAQSTDGKQKKTTRKRKMSREKIDTVARIVAGVVSVPPSFARPDQPFSHTPYGSQTTIDRAERARVDLDAASEAEIDKLPRIGPATAKRIVANRDSFGPFKSLDGLRRVKGMGPATLQRLNEMVTFSGVVVPRAPH